MNQILFTFYFYIFIFHHQLGEQLALLVPESGVDVVELEDEGVCVRFNPLMTAAGENSHTHTHSHTSSCVENVHAVVCQQSFVY